MKATFSPLLLAITLFTLLFAIGAWLFVFPDYTTLSQDTKTIAAYVPLATSKTSAVSAQQQQLQATKTQADTLLPFDNGEYDLSVQVEALCKNVGVTITNMSFTGADALPKTTGVVAAATSTAPNLALALSVTGSYTQIQQLTSGLVSINRFIQLTQVTLTGQQGASGQAAGSVSNGIVSALLNASAFYLPSAVPATPTPTP